MPAEYSCTSWQPIESEGPRLTNAYPPSFCVRAKATAGAWTSMNPHEWRNNHSIDFCALIGQGASAARQRLPARLVGAQCLAQGHFRGADVCSHGTDVHQKTHGVKTYHPAAWWRGVDCCLWRKEERFSCSVRDSVGFKDSRAQYSAKLAPLLNVPVLFFIHELTAGLEQRKEQPWALTALTEGVR